MPFYNTETAATALGVTPKWLDNLLSHNKIDGVSKARQGVARRLSVHGVQSVAVVRDLSSTLGIPVASAIEIARRLLHEPGRAHPVSSAIKLSLDASALKRDVASSLAHAVEVAPHRTRGRPRGS